MKKHSSPKATSPKSKRSSAGGAGSSAPTSAAVIGGTRDGASSDYISRDGANEEDLYVHTAADMVHRIVAAYCNLYDTSYITKYLLGLLLEALVSKAPSFSKEQAHNQLEVMSGSAGLREAVELVKFVQSAGRITNKELVENGRLEMERLNSERRIRFASDDEVARSRMAQDAASDDDESGPPDDITYISTTRGSLDLRVVPAASIHTELQTKCAAQEKRISDQEQRIRELEATLAEHRPVFEAVHQNAIHQETPSVVLKKAAKKGTVVKKGKSAVSFIDGEDDAAAVAPTSPTAASAAAAALAASTGVPILVSAVPSRRAVRYESTKAEVIAAARALALEARENNAINTTSSLSSSHYSGDPREIPSSRVALSSSVYPQARENAPYIAALSPPPSHARATPYMHDLSTLAPRSDPTTSSSGTKAAHYSLLADVPLHTSRYQPPPAPAQAQPQPLGQFVATPSTALDVLPLTSRLLSAEDVVRIVSDKRPLSAQATQSFSAWYHLEQEQRGKLLLDLGESSLVSSIQQNAQLSSRLAGAAHSLALERRYSSVNRAPSSLEFINFAHNAASPLSKYATDATARRHQQYIQQQQQHPQFVSSSYMDPSSSSNNAYKALPPQSAAPQADHAFWGGSAPQHHVNVSPKLPSRAHMLNADGSSVRLATGAGEGDAAAYVTGAHPITWSR